ncbi:MAG: tRNA (N(6)-L-threonylcarbamoyladenosine(37)-C(2))-methylthiotransferase MtaB [Bacteroidota bacterium]|nr:tRNA (N(6)-L-threonylcarbamoyladenosine(37)-C(2))-methylthiotransferase MtaB [Bacteroidota bacterium]
MALRFSTYTIGCKLNYSETASIRRTFAEAGLREVPFGEEADVVVVNTCTVTSKADHDTRNIIRRALRVSPRAFVIVTGCAAQLRHDELASIEGVDLIVGTEDKHRLLELAGDLRKVGMARVVVRDLHRRPSFHAAFASEGSGRTRAFLKIQDGCDYRCTYCTVPLARGGSRSADIEATVSGVRNIVRQGFQEIVLTGVNVGDYGKGQGASLADLVRAVIELPGDFRLRISSVEPDLLTDELIELAAKGEKICPHFHLPLQSGSDEILRLMGRRYDTAFFRERIEALKHKLPHTGIWVDVIVGFPGETEKHFEATRTFLEGLPVSALHVFTFSERPGTPAAAYGGHIPDAVKRERNGVLRRLSEGKRATFYRSELGSVRRVLFETGGERGMIEGFTENYIRVAVPQCTASPRTMRRVRLEQIVMGRVLGVVID